MKAFVNFLAVLIFFNPSVGLGFISEEDQINNSPPESSDLNLNKKFNLKTNVANIAFGIYNLSLEYKLSPNISMSAMGIVGSFEQKSNDKTYTFEVETLGGNLMLNYHLNEVYTNSFYASAFAGYLSIDVELKDFVIPASASIDTPYVGAEIGYVHYFRRFNITLGAGGSKTFKDEETEIQIGNFSGKAKVQVHLNYHLNASLGYVF